VFWDLFGDQGHQVRTTVLEMGPLLMARLLELNDTQEGVLNIAFRIADEQQLPLIDMKDLRLLLNELTKQDGLKPMALQYGNVADATVGSILRQLLVLENQGATKFFGEPSLAITDLIQIEDGRGVINVLAADKLMGSPRLYATFLLWLLSELFEQLPEVGDPEKPKLVFFFDEAHLLFRDAPKALVDKVEQVVRLIRSKGVGVYFISQSPDDLPENILGQLGNRVQHALRAFTARDQKALRLAAQTYRDNPRFSTEEAIRSVGTGEAVTSFLDARGAPGIVERTLVRPPSSQAGPIDPAARAAVIAASPFTGKYDVAVDRDSAFERLRARADAAAGAGSAKGRSAEPDETFNKARRLDGTPPAGPAPKPATRRGDSVTEAFAKSFARQLGSKSGQALVRGVLGSLFKGR
jgi:hypothetical protein